MIRLSIGSCGMAGLSESFVSNMREATFVDRTGKSVTYYWEKGSGLLMVRNHRDNDGYPALVDDGKWVIRESDGDVFKRDPSDVVLPDDDKTLRGRVASRHAAE